MKNSKYILLAALLLAVSSCGETTPSNSNNNLEPSSNPSVGVVPSESLLPSTSESESNPSLSDSSTDSTSEYYELPNWEETQFYFNPGNDLLDVAIGRPFMTGASYNISYSMSSSLPSVPSGERAVSSNEKVFTLEKVGSGFTLTTHHAGKAYLRIYDSNDVIRYCAVIEVKDPIPVEYMEEYLVYDCEYWVSMMSFTDNFVIIFNEGGIYTVSGYLSNNEFEPVTGTYEYVGLLNNGKEYEYKFTDQNIASLGLTGFHVATIGGFMYLQGEYGTEAIMCPSDSSTLN